MTTCNLSQWCRDVHVPYDAKCYRTLAFNHATVQTLTFGSTTCATPSTPSKFSSAFKSVRQAVDLPLPLGPTIINP